MSLGLLKHRGTIKRNTTTNVNGIITPAWADLATGVKCLIQEKAGVIKGGAAGADLAYDAVCFLPPGTDIRPKGTADDRDQFIQTTPATGVIYLVRHVADRSGMAHHLTAYLQRLPSA